MRLSLRSSRKGHVLNASRMASRSGFTLLEVILFMGILSIIGGTVLGVYLSTAEARARQRAYASVEQGGNQVVSFLTKNIRRAEKILMPATNLSGSILALQMAQNDEYPTLVAAVGSGQLILAQKSSTSALLTPDVTVSNLHFRNVGNSNISFYFDASTIVRTIPARTYKRRFSGTATLFPDDQSDAGGCGTCALPACVSHQYEWQYCDNGTCTDSDTSFAC